MSDAVIANHWGAKLRLKAMIITGMVLFAFITMHLLNLSLGLHSVQLMEDWRFALSGVWSSVLPLKVLLQVSLVVHFIIALYSLYRRNTLRVPAYDMAQMIAGVLIIPLMGIHVFGVMAVKQLGLEPTYFLILSQFWIVSPINGLQQVALLVVAWIHGAIGVYSWLRARDGSARVMKFFYPFVVLLPILAMLGFVEGGRQIISVDEGGLGMVMENDPNADGPTVDPEMIPVILGQAKERPKLATRVSLGLVALVLLARFIRLKLRERSHVRVSYGGRRPMTFESETGLTLLEMAHENSIPHANVCRGRGRCGTCRVRVVKGGEKLAPPSELEAKVLARWNAEPNERLACQVMPQEGVLDVERVVKADYSNLDYAQANKNSDSPVGAS